jgi:hypothetical protein
MKNRNYTSSEAEKDEKNRQKEEKHLFLSRKRKSLLAS